MDIGINEVKDMIESLESNGELSIKEEKYLKVAKLCVQLADENYLLKSAHPQPFGPEMMKALDAYEKQQDEVPEAGMLDAFFILRDSIRLETPATDRIVAGFKADGVESGIKTIMTMLNHQAPGVSDAINVLRVHSSELREGADK